MVSTNLTRCHSDLTATLLTLAAIPGRNRIVSTESLDGNGAADHNEPYTFNTPRLSSPFPFTTLQYGHLLAMRGQYRDGAYRYDSEMILSEGDFRGYQLDEVAL
jgi:hypothetical protein